jgi:DNA mismatch repair protein MutS
VVQAARRYLEQLEAQQNRVERDEIQPGAEAPQLSLFQQEAPALTLLRALDLDALSPREALDMLYRLREALD